MREVEFGGDRQKAKDRFVILYGVAFNGKAPEGPEAVRQLGKVQDALEDISVEANDAGIPRSLKEGVESLLVEDAPFQMMKGRFFGAGIDWLASASRRVTDAHDMWCAAKEVKPAIAQDAV